MVGRFYSHFHSHLIKITKFALVYSLYVIMADLNHLKVVLAEEKRTSVWLAEEYYDHSFEE